MPAGRRLPISISTALLKDEQGRIVGAVETFRDISVEEKLRKAITERYSFEDIISKNHRMHQFFDILPDVADSTSTVLLEGESGTGKELFARAIHHLSPRKKQPFIAVNCGALPDTLLESELFGYKAGAFTDAKKDKPGRFRLAERGTLFLDEIGDISPALQVRLLRVLQEKTYEPLGSVETVPSDVRIIAATNRRSAGTRQGGKIPRRPLLPDQRDPDGIAAAAEPDGGYSAAGGSFHPPFQCAAEKRDLRIVRRGPGLSRLL